MKYTLILLLSCFVFKMAFAEEAGHKENAAEHSDEHEAQGHEGHEAEEQSASVGPGKGVPEANEHDGLKLSPEATKNFEIKTMKFSGPAPWTVPIAARLVAGEEINIYRVRAGFYKRIDFAMVSKSATNMTIKGDELKIGDEVVVHGVGFLRAAELVAFGGEPEGHGH